MVLAVVEEMQLQLINATKSVVMAKTWQLFCLSAMMEIPLVEMAALLIVLLNLAMNAIKATIMHLIYVLKNVVMVLILVNLNAMMATLKMVMDVQPIVQWNRVISVLVVIKFHLMFVLLNLIQALLNHTSQWIIN